MGSRNKSAQCDKIKLYKSFRQFENKYTVKSYIRENFFWKFLFSQFDLILNEITLLIYVLILFNLYFYPLEKCLILISFIAKKILLQNFVAEILIEKFHLFGCSNLMRSINNLNLKFIQQTI